MGGTKLERFLPKDQHTQRKLSNFENWSNGEVSKSAKSPNLLTFKVNLLYQKLSKSFSIYFSLKNINLGACFLLLPLNYVVLKWYLVYIVLRQSRKKPKRTMHAFKVIVRVQRPFLILFNLGSKEFGDGK